MVSITRSQLLLLSPQTDLLRFLFSQTDVSHRREALYCLILGYTMDIIPMVLNGAVGADLHVNFAVASRSSFGFYLSRVAVIIRMITALFWHGMSS
jgi:cytosine/uracil/thiamine/allantoin permease